MGQVATLCSGDIFKQLQQNYGQTFVKLMVAEKSKEFVSDQFGKLNGKANQTFQGFADRTANIVDEKNKALSNIFQGLKEKVNSTVPGGIPALERLKGQSINEFSGFNSLLGQIGSVKTQAFSKIEAEKDALQGELNNKKVGMIAQIQNERPKIPIYEELPDPLRSIVRNKAEQTFADEISKNKGAIVESISKQFNLNNLETIFQKITPEGALNRILGGASGNLGGALGLGGMGNIISNGLSFLRQ